MLYLFSLQALEKSYPDILDFWLFTELSILEWFSTRFFKCSLITVRKYFQTIIALWSSEWPFYSECDFWYVVISVYETWKDYQYLQETHTWLYYGRKYNHILTYTKWDPMRHANCTRTSWSSTYWTVPPCLCRGDNYQFTDKITESAGSGQG